MFLCVTLPGEQQLLLEPALEHPRRGRVGRHFGPHRLERHRDAEFGVPGLVHRAHAAGAEQLDDVVALAEVLADEIVGHFRVPARGGAAPDAGSLAPGGGGWRHSGVGLVVVGRRRRWRHGHVRVGCDRCPRDLGIEERGGQAQVRGVLGVCEGRDLRFGRERHRRRRGNGRGDPNGGDRAGRRRQATGGAHTGGWLRRVAAPGTGHWGIRGLDRASSGPRPNIRPLAARTQMKICATASGPAPRRPSRRQPRAADRASVPGAARARA